MRRHCQVFAVWAASFGAPELLIADDLALVGAKVYRSPEEAPLEKATVLIQNGRIQALGPAGSIRVPTAVRQLDCKNLTVTAGFWNSHVHILPPGLLHARQADAALLTAELDKMFNRWGFTTVFDISSPLDNTLALRRRIDSGELRGPHILTTGEPVWTVEPIYVRAFLLETTFRYRIPKRRKKP
jgi:imidazolonepropionase-like amidohydrolase